MSYYVLDTHTSPFSEARLEGAWSNWFCFSHGSRRIQRELAPAGPCQFVLHQPCGPVEQIAAGYVATECLFSDEMIDVLMRAGVDNLDILSATLRKRVATEPIPNTSYKAVEIMGAIACLDKKRSGKVDLGDGSGLLEGGVDKMYIDERKTDGLLMFRPRPGMGAVLVHERVKRAIEAAKLPGLRFYDPAEWGGF